MRILLGFAIVLLLAIPSHAYFPINCFHTHAAEDFAKAEAVIVGQVAAFERITTKEKHKKLNGEECEITFFEYFAKLKIGRVITGEMKVDDEIWISEGYGEQLKDTSTEPHWIKQCMTHPRAGLGLGCAYILALNVSGPPANGKARYVLRSCHHSIHEITEVVNEETNARWFGVKVAEEEGRPAHYVTTDAFIEHMKKRAESVPAK